MGKEKKVDCFKCQHFIITWDKKAPYGCRIFNFKTSKLPSIIVKKNSNQDCQFFKVKQKKLGGGDKIKGDSDN
ncbi:MAG: uracil-DNA glycosylase [SAR324 cluster bacterium]|nr:uracil-DNA glycosylase [SAR324 cluster bacterium]